MATWETVKRIGLALPGAEESTSYRQPALKVRGKLFARMREEGDAITVQATFAERDALIGADPETFYLTDHYRNYEWVIVRLSRVPEPVLEELLTESWLRSAPPKLAREWEARQAG